MRGARSRLCLFIQIDTPEKTMPRFLTLLLTIALAACGSGGGDDVDPDARLRACVEDGTAVFLSLYAGLGAIEEAIARQADPGDGYEINGAGTDWMFTVGLDLDTDGTAESEATGTFTFSKDPTTGPLGTGDTGRVVFERRGLPIGPRKRVVAVSLCRGADGLLSGWSRPIRGRSVRTFEDHEGRPEGSRSTCPRSLSSVRRTGRDRHGGWADSHRHVEDRRDARKDRRSRQVADHDVLDRGRVVDLLQLGGAHVVSPDSDCLA